MEFFYCFVKLFHRLKFHIGMKTISPGATGIGKLCSLLKLIPPLQLLSALLPGFLLNDLFENLRKPCPHRDVPVHLHCAAIPKTWYSCFSWFECLEQSHSRSYKFAASLLAIAAMCLLFVCECALHLRPCPLFLPASSDVCLSNRRTVTRPLGANALPEYPQLNAGIHQQVLFYLQVHFSEDGQVAVLQ